MGGDRHKAGAARKGSPVGRPASLKIGDWVKVIDISADLKDPDFDSKDSEHREMRTAELFRFCVDREFRVRGFDRYGNVEVHVGDDLAVRRKFGRHHWIWMEREFLKRSRTSKVRIGSKKLSS